MTDQPFITTYSGTPFYLLEPESSEIDIRDIAHALSQLCRFTGHSRQLYTVAQHCLMVSEIVPSEFALEGLLHDATEAYVGDVSTPLKGVIGAAYTDIEKRVHAAIAARFKLVHPLPPEVKDADLVAFATEARDFMMPGGSWGIKTPDPLPNVTEAMSPTVVRAAFLDRFKELER